MLRPRVAPMGWNSWDCYGAAVTEKKVRQNAALMAERLKDYGWEYVVVDIQWYEPGAMSHAYRPFADLCMDEYGRLLPAPNRFPSAADGKGFAPLANYVHSLGLKFGIHIMRGIPRQAVHGNCPVMGTDRTARDAARFNSICAWNPDMYGVQANEAGWAYYASVFQLYTQWGVDFIKCDDICRELPHEEEELLMISEALENCGREMILSLSPGPALLEKAELYKRVANMWRITDDFWDEWPLLYAMFERTARNSSSGQPATPRTARTWRPSTRAARTDRSLFPQMSWSWKGAALRRRSSGAGRKRNSGAASRLMCRCTASGCLRFADGRRGGRRPRNGYTADRCIRFHLFHLDNQRTLWYKLQRYRSLSRYRDVGKIRRLIRRGGTGERGSRVCFMQSELCR